MPSSAVTVQTLFYVTPSVIPDAADYLPLLETLLSLDFHSNISWLVTYVIDCDASFITLW